LSSVIIVRRLAPENRAEKLRSNVVVKIDAGTKSFRSVVRATND